MMRRLDNLWFRVLAAAYRWIVRRLNGHCRRKTLRCFRRHLACQKPHLN